jgi:hypothetical protein
MRGLKSKFMDDLKSGMLKPLLSAVKADRDLSLEIRENYINVYAKGNSIPRVEVLPNGGYRCVLSPKFAVDGIGEVCAHTNQIDETADDPRNTRYNIYKWESQNDVNRFVGYLPQIKHRVTRLRRSANELEVEQLLVRTGSREASKNGGCNVEYFPVDRQCADSESGGRPDVVGLYWNRGQRRAAGQTVPLCIIEVKHMLNSEIECVHQQLWRYMEWWHSKTDAIADEIETIVCQKVDLGLLRKDLETLRVDRDTTTTKYVAALVDLNPYSIQSQRLRDNSKRFADASPQQRKFIESIEIFRLGYGLWSTDASRVLD